MTLRKLEDKERACIIANRIKLIRETKRLTQLDLARKAGISQATLSLLEMGKAIITIETLIAIADAMGCSLDYLIGREKVPVGSMAEGLQRAFERLCPQGQDWLVKMAQVLLEKPIGADGTPA
jgi:transcriptional regulator with XRE-family HTH domain